MSAVVSKVTKRRSGFLSVLQGSPILGPLAALMLACVFFSLKNRQLSERRPISL